MSNYMKKESVSRYCHQAALIHFQYKLTFTLFRSKMLKKHTKATNLVMAYDKQSIYLFFQQSALNIIYLTLDIDSVGKSQNRNL